MEGCRGKKVLLHKPAYPSQQSPRMGQGGGRVAITMAFGRELPLLACTDLARSLGEEAQPAPPGSAETKEAVFG